MTGPSPQNGSLLCRPQTPFVRPEIVLDSVSYLPRLWSGGVTIASSTITVGTMAATYTANLKTQWLGAPGESIFRWERYSR